MNIYVGKARLEAKNIGVNYYEWECIVFGKNTAMALAKVKNEINAMKDVTKVLDVQVKEVAIIA